MNTAAKRPERAGATPPAPRMLPSWKGNLVIFGILVLLVISYYFNQIRQTQRIFFDQAHYQARTVAGVIQRNAQNAILSRKAVEDILVTFLGNTARFIDYLNTVAPFSESELTAFALEAGLAGISIVMPDDNPVHGPDGWLPAENPCDNPGLSHDPAFHLYTLNHPLGTGTGCVVVGIHGAQTETLLEQVSLQKLLDTLGGLAPIQTVRIEDIPPANGINPEIRIMQNGGQAIAEARLAMGSGSLLLGLDASAYTRQVRALWREFMIFSTLLTGLGVFFSWLSYHYQQTYMARVRDMDRELARQREDAALGAATATITHEIRNPLNAISMGLQRLQLEAAGLAPDHVALVDALRQAVGRTNDIVSNLKRYATPFSITRERVNLDRMVDRLLELYQDAFRTRNIAVSYESDAEPWVAGDADLLSQVFENLIKNAVEAQPDGGFLTIRHVWEDKTSVIVFHNGGRTLPTGELDRIFEPYMTTKARGTGLGLAIVQRIVAAHDGTITAEGAAPGSITLTIRLPLSDECLNPKRDAHENSHRRR